MAPAIVPEYVVSSPILQPLFTPDNNISGRLSFKTRSRAIATQSPGVPFTDKIFYPCSFKFRSDVNDNA